MKDTYATHYRHTAAYADQGISTEQGNDDLYNRVTSAIETLPPQCRLIFRKSRFEEKKYAEIAQELGLSVKTVEVQIGKALKLLREKLATAMVIVLLILIVGWQLGHFINLHTYW